jgi:hypothetical protein
MCDGWRMSDGRALYGLKRKAPPTLCDPRELEERGRGSKLCRATAETRIAPTRELAEARESGSAETTAAADV